MTTATSPRRPSADDRVIELTDAFGRPLCPWEIAIPDEPCPTCGEQGAAKRARASRRLQGLG